MHPVSEAGSKCEFGSQKTAHVYIYTQECRIASPDTFQNQLRIYYNDLSINLKQVPVLTLSPHGSSHYFGCCQPSCWFYANSIYMHSYYDKLSSLKISQNLSDAHFSQVQVTFLSKRPHPSLQVYSCITMTFDILLCVPEALQRHKSLLPRTPERTAMLSWL